MKVEGTYLIEADQKRVWDQMLDPEVLASCIPGCEQLNDVGGGRYEAALRVGIGAISGTYSGTVTVSDQDEPRSFKLTVEGKGAAGNITGEGLLALDGKEGATEVHVQGEAHVTGLIARVGQRLLGGVSKTMTDQFFACLKSKIEAG